MTASGTTYSIRGEISKSSSDYGNVIWMGLLGVHVAGQNNLGLISNSNLSKPYKLVAAEHVYAIASGEGNVCYVWHGWEESV